MRGKLAHISLVLALLAVVSSSGCIVLGTISGDITYTPKVYIASGYEWRKVYITVEKSSWIGSFYFYAPILNLKIDDKTATILSQELVTYKGKDVYEVKIVEVSVGPGSHHFVARFDPEFNNLATHTGRNEGIDVNGDGKSSVLYSSNGSDWYEDVGVDLIYEIVGRYLII